MGKEFDRHFKSRALNTCTIITIFGHDFTNKTPLPPVMREALYYGTETALYGQGVAVACPRINELSTRT